MIRKNDVSQHVLSDITTYQKYAKYLPDAKRKESWEEICDRNKAMHIKKYPQLKTEIEAVYKNFVYTKKVLPSMRSLQFAGLPVEINNSRQFNCSFLPMDHPVAFAEIMFLLLGGTGVGYSVQKHHVEKLPEIVGTKQRPRRFLISDNIEGWADAVKTLIKAYTQNKSDPVFDFRDIRPKGARLITSGGKAPGPDPLRICLDQIRGVLNGAVGRKLTTLEVHDINCFIADAVLAGGIRRAAMISLFSPDDMDMLSAKSGTWYELNPQRGRANNSAVLLRSSTTKEEFMKIYKLIELSGAGEPGFFWTDDLEWGTNPCAEISLRPCQFCVAGDTKLITRDGIETIEDVVGNEIEIWNGEKWSKVSPYQTGENDRLHRVHFSDGSYLDATDNHKFLVKTRFENEYREVETLDLIEELKTSKYALQIPRSNFEYNEGVDSSSNAYDLGFVLGDGCIHRNSVISDLYGADKDLEFLTASVAGKERLNSYGTSSKRVSFDLDVEFCKRLKYENGLPKELFSFDRNSILQFIAGWADADGSQTGRGIRIYGREDKIRDGQLLLSKIGINSSVNLMSNAGTTTNLGERRNSVWYLQITRTIDIPCQRLICDNSENSKFKGKHQIVRNIETLEGTHKSFCLTEESLHQCVFNNVLTKQCNLTEINISTIESQEDLNARSKAASFLGTLQAGYTDFHYLRQIWQDTTEEEALLGVSGTGMASEIFYSLDQEKAAQIVLEENERVANIIGVNKAARTTCVKPAGTTSLVLGTSSGIHAWHDEYYIRRVRVGKNEALYSYLIERFPDLIEDCQFKPHIEAVMSFPQKAPNDGIKRNEEGVMEFLERVKTVNEKWVHSGHRTGSNRHNVSCTINIKDDEWEQVGEWLWDNRRSYTGVSILPYDGGTYVQAPFETCTEEAYNDLKDHFFGIDLTQIVEEDDDTNHTRDSVACAGGACMI